MKEYSNFYFSCKIDEMELSKNAACTDDVRTVKPRLWDTSLKHIPFYYEQFKRNPSKPKGGWF